MPKISFEQVNVEFGERFALRDFTVTLTEKRIGIIGANGSGKSTTARLINGLNEPSSGIIKIDDLEVRNNGRAVRKRIGFIFSDPENQIIMPTVAEDIALSLRNSKLSRVEKNSKTAAIMQSLGLTHLATASPHTLSGGEKQLLALAAILISEPEIIVADEPTTLLDLRNRLLLKDIFAQLNQQIIVVTHDLDFIRDFDRVLWIDNAILQADGPPQEVITAYQKAMSLPKRP
ncbi:energy-coupling factor ABC transporter ATP-binding protein [Corynebacterium caspium]|uniref:energy-coupling factor ABC transporter ATP-binding protein n=1 Tax=Corynebacterium caspium TaxID=234828 RepID=UPI000363C470|nr:energy-coupling factor ABC transporter ATP-binding protein [Corynebacterium caspium]WKD59110.1 Biotin transport ATP-binding protein BioM [Corynebacterium caspium DSM 44850]